MAGYTRQSSAEIVDTLTIDAVDLNNEFDALVSAFVNTTGHKHDGTAANGPVIGLIGDANLATPLNKILIDTANAELEFYINVGASATEQFKISDGLIVPSVDNDIDLGTATLEFKDAYFDGTVNLDTLVIGTATGITDIDTDLAAVSASDDTLASAKAIKAYVDASPVGDLTSIVAGTGLSGTSLSGPIPTLTIDTGTTVDKTTAQTLTNKTLTSPVINTPTGDVVTITGSQTLTNKTLTSPVLDTAISGTAFKDEDNFTSDSATAVASQQSIKAYIATQVSAGDLTAITTGNGLSGTSLTGPIPDLTIDTSITVDKTTTQTLSAKTLTSPVLNGTLSGTAFLDDDTLADDSAIAVASQQSIKAYVDTQVATIPVGDITAVVAGTGLTGGGTSGSVTLNADVSASSTNTFLNKTIDANGTGNSITNLEVADLASGVLDTDLTAVSASDDTLASAKAIKTYVDSQPHSSVTASSTTTFTNKTIDVDATGNSITNLADANIKAAAAIDATKIADGTVTSTEFQYINSLSANAQTQIDGKQATIDASSRLNANLVGDGSVDDTEFGYLDGVTSDIQTQLSAKASAGFAVAMAIAL
tara:strand:- start:250 stop:2028 length:1779 start_codon:yes stop_codon:yes gene_type:complete